jgi:transcriptional regulator with PAS, ATPase and Fis domain
MVTGSETMRKLFVLLERIARSDTSIVLRGETGTGKELAARAIHELSRRKGRPFRAINCATLSPELAASELFGHVRGAFTGAVTQRPGLFSLADTGTVFLDEVAELPLDVQSRLLRVLAERVFVPVGGSQPKEVDIRLITATHRSLREEVEARRFREDLMYRLRVVPVFIPPLVEREGDVEALLWHFIAAFNARGGRHVDSLEPEARSLLLEYPWPGNVRELRNAVEYAFTVGEGPVLDVEALPPELRGELPPHRDGLSSEEAERARIEDALRMSGGQKSGAA